MTSFQDFTNLRNIYAEKLKKLKDSSKTGAAAPAPAVGLGKSKPSHRFGDRIT